MNGVFARLVDGIPLMRPRPPAGTARFAKAVGTLFVSLAPGQLTQELSKAQRRGRIYVDTGRNGYSATFAAPYTVRARPGAPVSAPCTWQEVERGVVSPATFHCATCRIGSRRLAMCGRTGDARTIAETADGTGAPTQSTVMRVPLTVPSACQSGMMFPSTSKLSETNVPS